MKWSVGVNENLYRMQWVHKKEWRLGDRPEGTG